MKLARELERRLESALDGLAGRLFRGDLHSSELAARIAREAELAEFDTIAGSATANHFRLIVHPANLTDPDNSSSRQDLASQLAQAFDDHAAERGWRLEGPVEVIVEIDPRIAPGKVRCEASRLPGALRPWARLDGPSSSTVGPNRAVIGRSIDCDVVINSPEVSRHHALLFRQDGQAYVQDLDSANGTAVDGVAAGRTPLRLDNGSVLSLASVDLRFTHAPRPTPHASNA